GGETQAPRPLLARLRRGASAGRSRGRRAARRGTGRAAAAGWARPPGDRLHARALRRRTVRPRRRRQGTGPFLRRGGELHGAPRLTGEGGGADRGPAAALCAEKADRPRRRGLIARMTAAPGSPPGPGPPSREGVGDVPGSPWMRPDHPRLDFSGRAELAL